MSDAGARSLRRIGIAEAMQLFGMTARAIRLYEERGLIATRRDRLNHRIFDACACRRLGWIQVLREAGLPLAVICSILRAEEADGRGSETALPALQRRRRDLQGQLASVDRAVARLQVAPRAVVSAS